MTIFEFNDYRSYLRHFMASLPRKGRGSVNQIAQHLGVHSSLVSQILAGTKDFSVEQAQELCSFIGLGEVESDYFLLLVQAERAGTKKLKTYFEKKREKVRTESLQVTKRLKQDRTLTDEERAIFYSSWLYSAIRLFCSIGNGKNLDEIAKRFEISRARTQEFIEFLVRTQLCAEEEGLYTMGAQRIHLPANSPFVARLHTNWRIKSIQKNEEISEEELMFTAPMSISRKDFAIVREKIMTLIQAVSEQAKNSEAEDVACFSIDLFWVEK